MFKDRVEVNGHRMLPAEDQSSALLSVCPLPEASYTGISYLHPPPFLGRCRPPTTAVSRASLATGAQGGMRACACVWKHTKK